MCTTSSQRLHSCSNLPPVGELHGTHTLARLSNLIEQLEDMGAPGIGALRASAEVVVLARRFAHSDATNSQAATAAAYAAEAGHWLKGYASWPEWAAALPAQQLTDAQTVLSRAIADAERMLAAMQVHPTSPRPSTVDRSATTSTSVPNLTAAVVGADGFMRRADGGGAIFGSGYNKMLQVFNSSWLNSRHGTDELSADPAWSSLRRLGANLHTCHLYPQLLLLADGSIDEANKGLVGCRNMLAALPAHGGAVQILVANKLPAWAYALHSDLDARQWSDSGRAASFASAFSQHSVEYDIDHPMAMHYMNATLAPLARAFGCAPGLHSWIIANEPTFRATPSRHAAAAFHRWLRRRYGGCLECLNRAYVGSSAGGWHASFDDVLSSPTAPLTYNEATPDQWDQLDPSLDSGTMRRWLDWAAFNEERVAGWLTGLRDAIKSGGACHRVHAKFNTGPALPLRILDTGINRVRAARLLDINGLDSGFPAPFPEGAGGPRGIRGGPRRLLYDNTRYSCDWLHMAVVLPLIRSIAPHKLVVDSEWHVHTDCCTSARERFAEPTFSSVRVWFNALHGTGALAAWQWGRDATGLAGGAANKFNRQKGIQFVLSTLTQPLQMASMHTASANLQEHADIVASLASTRRSVHVLFCERCYHAGAYHARATYHLAEALTFSGVPWGFMPTDGDGDGSGLRPKLDALPAGDVLILPDVTHADSALIDDIEHWVASRGAGAVRIITDASASAPQPFAYNTTSGYPHSASVAQRVAAFLGPVGRTALLGVEAMLNELEDAVLPAAARRPIVCEETSGVRAGRSSTWGVVCMGSADWNSTAPTDRYNHDPLTHRHAALINVRATSATIKLHLALPGGGASGARSAAGATLRDLTVAGSSGWVVAQDGTTTLTLAPSQVMLLELSVPVPPIPPPALAPAPPPTSPPPLPPPPPGAPWEYECDSVAALINSPNASCALCERRSLYCPHCARAAGFEPL